MRPDEVIEYALRDHAIAFPIGMPVFGEEVRLLVLRRVHVLDEIQHRDRVGTAERRDQLAGNPQRLIDMDAQGIDVQAINVNAWGYAADRALARDIVALQNERISQWCAKHPDRFVGMATLALQHPDLAAEQLDHAVTKLGLRGAAIGGSVEGVELSDRKFDPFWAKAQDLGIVLFMHPQPAPGTTQNPSSSS